MKLSRMMKLRFLTLLSVLLAVLTAAAKVRLPHILGDNMVLQQQTDVRLCGWAKPGARISVKPSWSGARRTVAGRDGRWSLRVRTPEGGYTPLSITFSDGEPLTLHGILAGEVWVCAGQSNMEMPLQGFHECPVEGYQEAVAGAGRIRGMRYVKIPAVMRAVPQDDADCRWETVNANTANDCSAVGFFFARRLQEMTDLPVGLILADKGGTRVESWLDEDSLRRYTDEPVDSAAIAARYPTEWLRPLLWGNGTFHPVLPYTVRGILFYQGCSNVGLRPETYAARLTRLIAQWRSGFGIPDLPFYFVEIAPYSYGNALGTEAAVIRMQQQRVAQTVANTVLIGTNDLVGLGEAEQIHPCRKRQVGERLAMTAAARDYGFGRVFYRCPAFGRMEVRGDSCLVHLKDTYNGIAAAASYEGFEMAGSDRVYHPARARYAGGGTFVLTSPAVVRPVSVRYCFRNFLPGTVKNQAGLPLLPFTTEEDFLRRP